MAVSSQGEVGIEFMVVADRAVTYHVPLTYRGRPSGDHGLIGTSEHGVLGRRWIYDGPRDPVLVAQLVALIQGEAEPQAQSVSHTSDPAVIACPVPGGVLTAVGPAVAADVPSGTELRIPTTGGPLLVRINRILEPAPGGEAAARACPLPGAGSTAPRSAAYSPPRSGTAEPEPGANSRQGRAGCALRRAERSAPNPARSSAQGRACRVFG